MQDGTYMGHIIEHVALELQCLAGMEVSYGKTRSDGGDTPGRYHVVIEFLEAHAAMHSIASEIRFKTRKANSRGCRRQLGGCVLLSRPLLQQQM